MVLLTLLLCLIDGWIVLNVKYSNILYRCVLFGAYCNLMIWFLWQTDIHTGSGSLTSYRTWKVKKIMTKRKKQTYEKKRRQTYLTLFRSGGYQIYTCLPFSLYWLHGFRSESEQPDQNRVKMGQLNIIMNYHKIK